MSRYMRERLLLKLQSKQSNKEKQAEKAKKGDWYKSQLAQEEPKCCENCNKPLYQVKGVIPTTFIAHILAKRKEGGCPSVAYDEHNRMFLCDTCHDLWDKASSEEKEAMPVYRVAYHRVQTFLHLIPANEKRNVPECFTKSLPDLLL